MSIKGKTEARIFTPPLRPLTAKTSLGFAIIDYAEHVLGETLYPWQAWLLKHAFEIVGSFSSSWRFRFRTVCVMVGRQNGKTKVSAIIASFFQNVLGVENIFGTSLSLDKAEEVWEIVVGWQEAIPALKANLARVSRTNGNKSISLTGGQRYKVGAPTRRAGRGDSNDLVILDEVRELRDWDAWSAAFPSILAKPRGILVAFSNAGDPDSVVLRQLRGQAIAAIDGTTDNNDFGGDVDADTLGFFEWSATDGAKMTDWAEISRANPALGYGLLTERAIIASRQTLTEAAFRSECLCQQVATILPQPFPEGAWAGALDADSGIAAEADLYFGIDLSHDRRWTSIGVCGLREDGNYHIEVVARAPGTEWAIDWFRTRAERGPMRLAFQSRGAPVGGLAEQICTLEGVERCAVEGSDLTSGWGRFWDGIAASSPESERQGGTKIYHLEQPVMDAPAQTMQLRQLGGGVAVPDRVKSPDDIAPLFACIMAFTAATTPRRQKENTIYESAYADGSTLVFV